MQNHLKDETSPYLLQHADNPVDWYPWCEEAFLRAKKEDKPIFLSIGYSTCHWCHVMAHESFEDKEIAEILNRYFISIKVDREERPDIDHIYMTVCQAFTGSGGWPTTIFLTPEQKPFFAGTYFPKTSAYGRIGLKELLLQVKERWECNRKRLLDSAEDITSVLQKSEIQDSELPKNAWKNSSLTAGERGDRGGASSQLIGKAVAIFKESFDERFGGFGDAPKFPTPHNLLFLMRYYEKSGDEDALKMAEKTLLQMYCGGLFDHIGGGFCRYSTDAYFLVPHFEKMLYDNALLLQAYCKAFQMTNKEIYLDVAQKTALFVLREMTSPEGAFYSAKDADSEGVEGKFYLFEPAEILQVLGEDAGEEFNAYYDITEHGNFEGKSIPNLLHHSGKADGEKLSAPGNRVDEYWASVYEYRSCRYALHQDDKILTSWNGLMIAALCSLYRVSGKCIYLEAAVQAWEFICDQLCERNQLSVSYRNGKKSGRGFLDDYAFSIYALLALYEATLDTSYVNRAKEFCRKTVSDFYDRESGGFFLYGTEHEKLVLRPKETYDGAVFSGNSAMAYNMVRLSLITGDEQFRHLAKEQLAFMGARAEDYPAGYAMFLLALLDDTDAPDQVVIVKKNPGELNGVACRIPLDMLIMIHDHPDEAYPLKNDRTTYYVCRGHSCQPPTNEL